MARPGRPGRGGREALRADGSNYGLDPPLPAAPGQKIGFADSEGSEDLRGGKHRGTGVPA